MHALVMDNVVLMTCARAIVTFKAQTVPNVSIHIIHCIVKERSCRSLINHLTLSFFLPLYILLFISYSDTCAFGRAHVDTPKGDLDGSLSVGDFDDVVLSGSTVYPYGTTEGFPLMADTAGNVYSNTAHDYMECSNKGLCDRDTGHCECLPGYDGVACQRASCPSTVDSITPGSTGDGSNLAFKVFNSKSAFVGRSVQNKAQTNQCSGHGTCMTQEHLAFLDNDNIYNLWDKDTTMGCKCDPG